VPSADEPWDLTELVCALAHEIKNPLSTIQLNLDMLAEQVVGQASCERRLKLVRGECDRLRSLVDRFSQYIRPIRDELVPQDVGQHLAELVEFVRPQAATQGVVLEAVLASNLPLVRLEVDGFRAAVLNLLLNALAATSVDANASGSIIYLRTAVAVGGVLVEVKDTGCGMDTATLDRAFALFFTTRRGGTGLGLPVARRLIEAHGGRLALASTPGEGTTATIWLPTTATASRGDNPCPA
jgi:signal transduction histidine kinase